MGVTSKVLQLLRASSFVVKSQVGKDALSPNIKSLDAANNCIL